MSIARVIFDQDHEIFRASVRRFMTDTVAPQVERWREQGFVDREIYRQAGERGYLLMWSAIFATSRSSLRRTCSAATWGSS
jgi:alkylation response protein AidB-like acyl-CoA dehydrogenase